MWRNDQIKTPKRLRTRELIHSVYNSKSDSQCESDVTELLYILNNKDCNDNNKKDFSDNNDQNVKQREVHQDRKKIRRCGICFGVGHDRRNCPQARFLICVILYNNNVENLCCFLCFGVTCTCKDEDPLEHIEDHMYDNFEYHFENQFEFNDNEADYTIDDDNIEFQKEQSHVTHDYVSPGGSSYWILVVSDNIKPKINSIFDSYTTTLSMYDNYASLAGFDVRLGPFRTTESNINTQRHLLCNREGKPTTAKVDTLDPQHNKIKRRKDSIRCECKVKFFVILLHGTNKYNVAEFVEQHNHMLFGKDNMFLSRTKRKLDYSQEMFIHNLSKQNIGGSDIRGGLVSDFKNSTRNLNSYIGARDAKFLVLKMLERKKNIPSFSFDFRVVEKKLNSIFWADETAKYNYNAFGDVVSMDATFSMNKYDMVFVPFTGIDNHKKCVTFDAGILSREDASSYSWLLRAFLKSFKKQPTLVLTDQDPALNKVVNEVFPMSAHRFCMWHITKRLPNKITSQLATNSAFRKLFHSIIWNSKLEPHDFEKEWKSCLNEFNISNKKWLQEMYGLRRRWVPAFFKDIPMSGLMRTTSLSEGQIWSFQNNTLTGSYLLMVLWNDKGVIKLSTTLNLLQHFLDSSHLVQLKHMLQRFTLKEISDSDNICFQMSVTSNNCVDTIIVLEKQKNITTMQPSSPAVDDKVDEYHYDRLTQDTQYIVTHSTTDGSYKCTCMHFEHVGILCKHIFFVFKFYSMEQIHEEYIMKRRFSNSLLDSNSDMTTIEIFSNVDRCVSFLSHDASKLKSYLEEFNKLKKKLVDDCPAPEMPSREAFCNQIIGVELSNNAPDIDNPSDIHNKGTGSRGKRLKSKKEMLQKVGSKPKRKCTLCKQMDNHDKQNCPLKKRV
uniref:SWIM-type domain-containing protein n=1 Tax=Lactuca sativa TaxID=4236 RepID=A0A9R1VNE4_LACSA|nr:hypothetical protein LSAT_V11C500268080 [Lactuca sativa]